MMIVPPFISRALASWLAWRTKRKLYSAAPEMRDLDAAERLARASHRPVRQYQRQRQALMTDLLRRSVHHG